MGHKTGLREQAVKPVDGKKLAIIIQGMGQKKVRKKEHRRDLKR